MNYTSHYESPLGGITIESDGKFLTGVRFDGQKYFAHNPENENSGENIPVLDKTKRWLDVYFSGRKPDFEIPIYFCGTDFQNEVWKILCSIPYGSTMTYGEIAKIIANRRGAAKMSAQAVGGAISKNPISIIIPCHRVIGSNGSLTGYAGGIDKKIKLLQLEGAGI